VERTEGEDPGPWTLGSSPADRKGVSPESEASRSGKKQSLSVYYASRADACGALGCRSTGPLVRVEAGHGELVICGEHFVSEVFDP